MPEIPMNSWKLLYEAGRQALQDRKLQDAEQSFSAALQLAEDFAAGDPRLGATLNALARIYSLQRRYLAAAALLNRLLEVTERTLGPTHVQVAGVLTNLAEMYTHLGAAREELELRERVLRIRGEDANADIASLQRVWACDASLYSATRFSGPRFLLAGDAGSFIDPLSSFGIKKALASAWLGAIVVHTRLTHADREALASDFFSDWERRVYATHLEKSRDFARAACAEHPSAFWTSRADVEVDAPADADDVDLARDPDVQRAFAAFKAASRIDLTLADGIRFASRPVVRDREIVLEDALAGGMRFVGNVDLVTLARMAGDHQHMPDLFDAYCQRCAPVPLPSVVGGLSLLVAKGILHERR